MDSSQRLSLPFISPGQAQKEFYHNEALQMLDQLVAAAVEEPPLDDPPSAPLQGNCFLVGRSPTGEWAGCADSVAAFTSGGWRFASPVEGMVVWVKSAERFATYFAGAWEIGGLRGSRLLIEGIQVLGPQAGAIPDPTGGTSVDVEGRTAITAILGALRQHGLISET